MVVMPRLLLQLPELHLHRLAQLGVERRERLVEQEELRRARQRAGDRDALPLPARKLRDRPVGEAGQMHELQQLVHARLLLRLRRRRGCGADRRCSRRRSGAGRAPATGTPCRNRADARPGAVMSAPSIRMRPALGSSSPAIMRSSVVFPQPDGPSRQTKVPCATESVTSSTAVRRRSAWSDGRGRARTFMRRLTTLSLRERVAAKRPGEGLTHGGRFAVADRRIPSSVRFADTFSPWGEGSRSAGGELSSRDDQLGPLLVQPVRLRLVEVVARDDRRDVGGDRGEFLVASDRACRAAPSATCRPCARAAPGSPACDAKSMKACASSSLVEALRHHPGAGIVDAAFLREGGAHRMPVGGGEAGHVVIVLAHRDLARFQRLLELRLVAVPEFHVRLQLGDLVHHLEDALVGVELLGVAAEEGLRRDLQQERVGDERQQPELVGVRRDPTGRPRSPAPSDRRWCWRRA